jgi:hypothetical protein
VEAASCSRGEDDVVECWPGGYVAKTLEAPVWQREEDKEEEEEEEFFFFLYNKSANKLKPGRPGRAAHNS